MYVTNLSFTNDYSKDSLTDFLKRQGDVAVLMNNDNAQPSGVIAAKDIDTLLAKLTSIIEADCTAANAALKDITIDFCKHDYSFSIKGEIDADGESEDIDYSMHFCQLD